MLLQRYGHGDETRSLLNNRLHILNGIGDIFEKLPYLYYDKNYYLNVDIVSNTQVKTSEFLLIGTK
jgi:hypothetical protein